MSATFLFFVLRQQLQLFKQEIEPTINRFRKVLFAITIVMFTGNIGAVVLNVLTILAEDNLLREESVSGINVLYGFTNVITFITSSLFIWLLYRLAGRTAAIVKQDTADALNLSDQQYADKT